MSRRLPVYLVLDVSGSMGGEPITAVRNGVKTLLSALRGEPMALETAYISVITFSSTAQQVVPLTDLISFQEPNITAGGSTSLGAALRLLQQKIDTEVTKTDKAKEIKGDWRPMVFLMTDGGPTDDWQSAAGQLNKKQMGVFVACAAGSGANVGVLKQLTESVVELDTADADSIRAFFEWVSASVVSSSTSVTATGGQAGSIGALPPPPPEVNIVI